MGIRRGQEKVGVPKYDQNTLCKYIKMLHETHFYKQLIYANKNIEKY